MSVDSADVSELARAARSGADHLLSLDERSLEILPDGSRIIPILVANPHGDLGSLQRAATIARARGIDFILDPILDPIYFGFAASIERYIELRRREPEAEIMMGTGNLTELTDADSSGVTATLLGLCSELDIRHLLTVQVSPHTRRTLEEHDAARRMMFAARADRALPKGYSDALLQIHDKRPFASTPDEIAELARALRDANFRIETAEDGIHIFARDFHRVAQSALELFPLPGVEQDGAHAFYLGAELMKAEIAYLLGEALPPGRAAGFRRRGRSRTNRPDALQGNRPHAAQGGFDARLRASILRQPRASRPRRRLGEGFDRVRLLTRAADRRGLRPRAAPDARGARRLPATASRRRCRLHACGD